MRQILLSAAVLALAACAATDTGSLASADAATSLVVGERLTMSTSSAGGGGGQDPLVLLTLTHADGRSMRFEEANHAPHDLVVQAADGPLAQVMGLFGGETPLLYRPRDNSASFICGAEGPAALGLYRGADGAVSIVGLSQDFHVETRADGGFEAAPFSPDMVCARLRFRAS